MTTQQTVLVTGNTYPVKDAIKALGARWDATAKGWRVPVAKAAEAQAIVAGAGPKAPLTAAQLRAIPSRSTGSLHGRRTGCRCGSIEGRPSARDCRQCQYDNE